MPVRIARVDRTLVSLGQDGQNASFIKSLNIQLIQSLFSDHIFHLGFITLWLKLEHVVTFF